MDPYAVLGVPRDSSAAVVRKAYLKRAAGVREVWQRSRRWPLARGRRLALTSHPDKKGGSVEAFRQVQEAYERLRPSRRASPP